MKKLHPNNSPSQASNFKHNNFSGMGGCCCSSRKPPPLHGRPVYYYCPPISEEEDESLTSNDSVATALTSGYLVDLNLDTSIPDTYRSPPTPIPFNVVLGPPQSPDTESARELISGSSFEKDTSINHKGFDCKSKQSFLLTSPNEIGVELFKSNLTKVSMPEEDDVCPTCLDDYDMENPKIITKCNHHFHLSCILEWMERSDSCPICDQEMIYEDL